MEEGERTPPELSARNTQPGCASGPVSGRRVPSGRVRAVASGADEPEEPEDEVERDHAPPGLERGLIRDGAETSSA